MRTFLGICWTAVLVLVGGPGRTVGAEDVLPPSGFDGAAAAADAATVRPSRRWQGPEPFAAARGPVEVRDEFMLAQPRLTLPAVSPDPLCRGAWRLRVQFDWGNDHSFSQTGPAESSSSDRRFLVDGEHRTFEVGLRYGLREDLDVGVRLPLQWRGAGIFDPLIDWWHGSGLFDDNARPAFFQNQYRVEGRDEAFHRYSWNHEKGTGLGNIELETHWAFLRPRQPMGWRAALVGRAALPTGTAPYDTGSWEVGVQLAAAKRLHRKIDLYGGAGGTWYSKDDILGIRYEPWRGYGFLVLEWRPWRRWSLLLQTDVSSRLVTNLVRYPGVQWYIQLGAKVDLDCRSRFVFGFTENIIDQQSTVDAAFWLGLEMGL